MKNLDDYPLLVQVAANLGAATLAADVALCDGVQRRTFSGAAAVEEQLARLFCGAFAPVRLELRRAAPATAGPALVIRLQGVHRRRLWGIAPTGRSVHLELQLTAALHAGALTQLWLTYDGGLLLEQLGLYAPVLAGGSFPGGETP